MVAEEKNEPESLDDKINALYEKLRRILVRDPEGKSGEYQTASSKLRNMQEQEAVRLAKYFRATRHVDIEAYRRALAQADALLTRYNKSSE